MKHFHFSAARDESSSVPSLRDWIEGFVFAALLLLAQVVTDPATWAF